MEISPNDYLIGFAGMAIGRVSFKSIRSIHSGTERVWLMSIYVKMVTTITTATTSNNA